MAPPKIVDERRFVPETIAQAQALYSALVRQGTPITQARGLVTWLILLPERRSEDPASDVLRRDYRRELLRLGAPTVGC